MSNRFLSGLIAVVSFFSVTHSAEAAISASDATWTNVGGVGTWSGEVVTASPGKKIIAALDRAYNPYACPSLIELWSWSIVTPPTHGTLTFGSIKGFDKDIAYNQNWNCGSVPQDLSAIYYTPDPGTTATSDYFVASYGYSGPDPAVVYRYDIKIVPADEDKNNGKPDCPNCADGNPINGATGNKYQQEVDFVGGPSTGLALKRVYNSKDANISAFGAKWRSNWQGKLTVLTAGAQILVLRPDGRQETFTKNASNLYVADADVRTRLSAITGGWRVVSANDDSEDYTADGRLSKITTRSGLVTTLAYDTSNRLTTVTGPFGHKLLFAYDASNRISQMTAPDGQLYKYAYDANNNLLSVTYPGTKVRTYVYGDGLPQHANFLTGISDENGGQFATFTYNSQKDGAESSVHAGGVEKTTFAYAANQTKITTPLGAVRTHTQVYQFGMVKPSAVTGAAVTATGGKAFAYDANGFLSSRTDWNGNVTTYVKDARGNETSRTEASGTTTARTTTTTWHATFHLPLKRTEPGRVTDFAL